MSEQKIPLRQQIAAVQLELEQRKGGAPRKMTRGEAEYHLPKLAAAVATLQWLQRNEPKIREIVTQ